MRSCYKASIFNCGTLRSRNRSIYAVWLFAIIRNILEIFPCLCFQHTLNLHTECHCLMGPKGQLNTQYIKHTQRTGSLCYQTALICTHTPYCLSRTRKCTKHLHDKCPIHQNKQTQTLSAE